MQMNYCGIGATDQSKQLVLHKYRPPLQKKKNAYDPLVFVPKL